MPHTAMLKYHRKDHILTTWHNSWTTLVQCGQFEQKRPLFVLLGSVPWHLEQSTAENVMRDCTHTTQCNALIGICLVVSLVV